jgi:hypothetical protein
VLLVLMVLATAATDEGGVSWPERLSRVLPLTPVSTAAATLLALVRERRRGEDKALQALGRAPAMNASGAALGALLVGLVVALVVAFDERVALAAFFPTVRSVGLYTFDGEGWDNARTGVHVGLDGSVALSQASLASAALGLPAHARLVAALVVALGSASFGLLSAVVTKAHLRAALVVVTVTAASSALSLQAAAAGRAPALWALVPSVGLLAFAAWVMVQAPRRTEP